MLSIKSTTKSVISFINIKEKISHEKKKKWSNLLRRLLMIQAETAGGENVVLDVLIHVHVNNFKVELLKVSENRVTMHVDRSVEMIDDSVDGFGLSVVHVAKHHRLAVLPRRVDVLVPGNRRSSIRGFHLNWRLTDGRRGRPRVRRVRDQSVGRIKRRVREIRRDTSVFAGFSLRRLRRLRIRLDIRAALIIVLVTGRLREIRSSVRAAKGRST
uniref:Uncharacterized protein n=1 Tax=Phoenicopteridae CRESS-DNA-virus sp. TaxID=2815051 RepID=A0A8A4XCI0_9VIRU|nr:MAG: hypothetical protein [Phoenicopteridae CRESS-DNA-virus sp.]